MTKQHSRLIGVAWLILPFLPILALRFLPVMRVFQGEAGVVESWYVPLTSVLWWICALFLAPATALATLLKAAPFTAVHVAIMIAYATLISFAIFKIRRHDVA